MADGANSLFLQILGTGKDQGFVLKKGSKKAETIDVQSYLRNDFSIFPWELLSDRSALYGEP